LTNTKKNIIKTLSRLILIPYHWYCALKEIPKNFRKVSSRKPTNKEFTQHYNSWLKKQSRLGIKSHSSLEGKQWLPSFSINIAVSQDTIAYLPSSIRCLEELNYPTKQVNIGFITTTQEELDSLKKQCFELTKNPIQLSSNLATNEASAFNESISLSNTDYCFCMRSGDLVEPHTLTRVAQQITSNPALDLVYFDEGKVNTKGIKHIPQFKPKWSPDLILSYNYLGHGVFLRTSLFKSLNKFDTSYSSSYLYDILLKLTENTDHITHIPEVLFHKKSVTGNPNKIKEELQAIENALQRRNEAAKVIVNDERKGIFHIRYQLNEQSKISIIIPSRDQGKILDVCLQSIYDKTSYTNYEIILIDNGSTEALFFDVVKKWQATFSIDVKLLCLDIPFNFSRLNNLAAQQATGDYLLFLNNDIEVLTPDWLSGMLEQAQRSSTGAVGAKLLFPNDEIQHAGIFLGVDGISTHPFAKNTEEESHYYVNSIVNYTALTGACLMLKKSTFDEVNGFDEEFVIEFNDFDLCLKLVRAGYNNVYLPHVILYHYESYSRGKKHKDVQGFMCYRNERSRFMELWGKYIKNDPSYNPNLHKDSDQIFKPRLD
jgi:GT2 family glycosyltransferase